MTVRDPLPSALRTAPFTLESARDHGLTLRMVRGRRYRRLFRRVYVCADVKLDLQTWVRAAMLVLPTDATVTGLTGLHARGIHVGPAWPLRFVTTHPHPVRRPRLEVSRVRLLPPGQHRCASAAHCYVVACADLDLVDAVTAGDWLVHRGRVTLADLRTAPAAHREPGSRMARRAAALVRQRVESPRETHLRLLLVLAGLPEPECNVALGSGTAFIGRADLVYPEYFLIVEYDGRDHVDVQAQWDRDLDRLDDFEDTRWGHVRVTKHRLRRPRDVVRRVHSKLVAHHYEGPAPVFGPEWVALFETLSAARRAAQTVSPRSWVPGQ
ncbi:hypothetical protein BH24ACT12_BH24ACT12_01070 [soil metagenome]